MGKTANTAILIQKQYDEQMAAQQEYLYGAERAQEYYKKQDQLQTLEVILESLQQPPADQAETRPAESDKGLMIYALIIAVLLFLSKRL